MPGQPRFPERSLRRDCFAIMVLATVGLGLTGAAHGQLFTEFPIPTAGSYPQSIAAGPDGNLWFTEAGSRKIGRITLAGVITEFPIPTAASYLQSIAAGPDGSLWFTEAAGAPPLIVGKIGRITAAGVITEFELPKANSVPYGITSGPDGNLWFTESSPRTSGGDKIGRITPAGFITEFLLPQGHSSFYIAAGPDGNLWFTEQMLVGFCFAGKIGRITPDGAITEFELPSGLWNPVEIVAGPDGNLWFTETEVTICPAGASGQRLDAGADHGDKIGRITTEGVVTEFTICATCEINRPWGIAAGPDGNLWFTESSDLAYGGNRIGRITPAGAITEFIIPTVDSFPLEIAKGADGNLWFIESSSNKIGRISPSAAATCASSATNLCLNNVPFKVEATWTTPDGAGGSGHAVALTADSGYFWFFSPDNPEVMVSAHNACSFNNRQWIFAAGLTNVNVVLKVTDMQTGQAKTYTNPQGTAFLPIQDTSAFACP